MNQDLQIVFHFVIYFNLLNIMTRIYYIIHILLQSKYKFLIAILMYFLISVTYNLCTTNTILADCMMRSNSYPSLQADTYLNNNGLEIENLELTEQNLSLKQELELLRDQILTERIENEYTIGIFEENQRFLIAKNRALQAELLEIKETMGQISGDNIELREQLRIHREYSEILRRNLEISQERNEELSKALLNIAKNKTSET